MTPVANCGCQQSPLTGNCGKQASQSHHREAMKYQARLTLASPGLCVRLAQGLPLVKPAA